MSLRRRLRRARRRWAVMAVFPPMPLRPGDPRRRPVEADFRDFPVLSPQAYAATRGGARARLVEISDRPELRRAMRDEGVRLEVRRLDRDGFVAEATR